MMGLLAGVSSVVVVNVSSMCPTVVHVAVLLGVGGSLWLDTLVGLVAGWRLVAILLLVVVVPWDHASLLGLPGRWGSGVLLPSWWSRVGSPWWWLLVGCWGWRACGGSKARYLALLVVCWASAVASAPGAPSAALIVGVLGWGWALLLGGEKNILLLHLCHLLLEILVVGGEVG